MKENQKVVNISHRKNRSLQLNQIYFIKFHLLIFILLLTVGCNDDYLQRAPLDQVSNETFWNTEADLSLYNLTLYNTTIHDGNNNLMDDNNRFDPDVTFMDYHGFAATSHWLSPWFRDGASDNMAPIASNQSNYIQIRSGKVPIPPNPNSQRYGYRGWSYIRAVNFGLANYNKAEIAATVRDKYVAEAKLFRAWFYDDKVQKFGDVPWVSKPLNIDSEELYAPRTPREQAMDSVLADLNFAISKLPGDWGDGNEPGRLNRWCALLVKARICLFEGTWRKYHGGANADMWIMEAANASKELIDNGPYSLYKTGKPESDYNAYFRKVDISGNSEVMYYKKYIAGVGFSVNNMQRHFSVRHNYGGATKSLVEDYLCTDGLPITLSPLYAGDDSIETVFMDRDPRLRQTIYHPGDYGFLLEDGRDYPRVTGMTPSIYSTTTGYHVIKYYNPEDYVANNNGESPCIILRFGEALLIYAEAQAELGVITQNDLDISINQLRDRVGMPHLNLNPPMDPRYANDGISSLLVEIRRERRIELAVEGWRYDDLRRWKQGKKLEKKDLGLRWDAAAKARYIGAKLKTYTDPNTGVDYIDPYGGTDWEIPVFNENKDYLWPIPLSSLAENPNLSQNPGWN